MNFKTTYILFGFLAGVFILLALALFMDPGAVDSAAFIFPSMRSGKNTIQVDEVDRVEVDRKKPIAKKLVFELDPATKRWNMTAPKSTRTDKFAIQEIVRQLREAKPDTEADRPSNLAQWGLDDPSAVITLKKKDSEHTISLKVGNTSPGESSAVVYVLSSDNPREPLAVKKSLIDGLFKPQIAFREKDLLCPSVSDIKSFKLEETGKKSVAVAKTGENKWRYTEPASYGEADYDGGENSDPIKVTGGVRGLLMNISNLKVDYKDDKNNDFVSDDNPDLAKYKLDPTKDKVLQLSIERIEEGDKTSNPRLIVALTEKVGEAKDKYYAMVDDGKKEIVRISVASIEPLLRLAVDPEGLRERTLVKIGTLDKPDAIKIKNNYGSLEFLRADSAKPWMFYRPGKDFPDAINEAVITNLISVLGQKGQVKSFLDSPKDSELELDKPQAELSIYIDGIDKTPKEEPKDEKKDESKKDDKSKDEKKEIKKEVKPSLKAGEPRVKVLFGKRENGLVVFKRIADKETTYGKVPETLLDKLKDSPLAYLDTFIPKFTESADVSENVTKLSITRGGKTFEVTRDKNEDPWKIVSPTEQAGKNADASLVMNALGALNNLKASRLVAEKAPEGELTREYGLNPAATKAVVTLGKDKDAKTFEFGFGKDSPDKTGVYARQAWRDFVFITDRFAINALEAEFQDLVVFPKLDPAKIESIKLTGWQSLLGSPFTIDLERKEKSWIAKAPPDFKIDPVKIEALASSLGTLKAEKFISFNSGTKPEQELDLAKGALQVEFKVQGEKESQKLMIGKLEGDKSYFATSGKFTDVFLIPKAAFESMRVKPAYFSP